MNDTEKRIKKEIYELMEYLEIDRMPTNQEMKENGFSSLSTLINKNGKTDYWINKLNLKRKKLVKKWNDKKIKEEINKTKSILRIKRMPTATELDYIGRNDLHCAISKNGGYRKWADNLDISLKSSETQKGLEYEDIGKEKLEKIGFKTKSMSNGHPFDLLVNGNVKIDVKMGKCHKHFGTRCHTFKPSSKFSTCDIYICFAIDENDDLEKTFVIPSKFAKVETLNICKNSKYNKFIDRWDLIEIYADFYDSVIV